MSDLMKSTPVSSNFLAEDISKRRLEPELILAFIVVEDNEFDNTVQIVQTNFGKL